MTRISAQSITLAHHHQRRSSGHIRRRRPPCMYTLGGRSEEAATVLRGDRQLADVRAGVRQDPGELIYNPLLHRVSTRQEPCVLEARTEQIGAGVHQCRRVVVGHNNVVAATEALVEEDAERGGVCRILDGGGAGDGVDASVRLLAAVLQTDRAVLLDRVVGLNARLPQLADKRVPLDLVPLTSVLQRRSGA